MEFKEKFEILMEIVEQNIKDGNAADILGRAEQETGYASYIVGDAFTYIANMNISTYSLRLGSRSFSYHSANRFNSSVEKCRILSPPSFSNDLVVTILMP